jgi:tRNA pseudouridine55 synthase
VATDTHDADGTIVALSDRVPDETAVREALAAFRGEQWQHPPQFAAIKQGGQRLYRRARAGEDTDIPPRRVRIDRLELLRWSPPAAHVLLHCSPGTYVRSLARDLGAQLDCGAYAHRLVRVASGPFTLAEARTLDAWEAAFADGSWRELVHAPDAALLAWPALLLDAAAERALGHGMPLAGRPPRASEPDLARAYDGAGRLAGVLHWEESRGRWQPTKVLR